MTKPFFNLYGIKNDLIRKFQIKNSLWIHVQPAKVSDNENIDFRKNVQFSNKVDKEVVDGRFFSRFERSQGFECTKMLQIDWN